MQSPLISIVVPVYNTKKYLRRCVDSLINQTYQNLEIILVNDGSTDGSDELCNQIAETDERIKVVHKQNGGLSSARNAGLDVMSGQYVGFVDSDDWVEEETYELLLAESVNNDAEIVCCGTKICNDEEIISVYYPCEERERLLYTQEEALKELTYNRIVTGSVCDKLYKAHIFDGLRMKEGILYEDSQVQPYCILRAKKIVFISDALYCYYQSSNSILRGAFSTRHYDIVEISKERLALYIESYPQLEPYAKMYFVSNCLDVLLRSYKNPQWESYRKQIKTMLKSGELDFPRKINRKVNIKYALCKLSVGLYCKVNRVYLSLRSK